MQAEFRSKIDSWIIIVTSVGIGLPLLILIITFPMLPVGGILVIFTVLLFIGGLQLWLFMGTKYTFTKNTLSITCGPFRKKIFVDQIMSVKPSNSMISGPALSLERLEIKCYNGDTVLISPKDKTGFLEHLENLQKR